MGGSRKNGYQEGGRGSLPGSGGGTQVGECTAILEASVKEEPCS